MGYRRHRDVFAFSSTLNVSPYNIRLMADFLFTSESVTEGHPDKICDRIADAVLDDILSHDPAARVACEVVANTGMLLIFGEITTSHDCRMPDLAREVVRAIGYSQAEPEGCGGFTAESCAVLTSVKEQSPNIAQKVNQSEEARSGSSDPLDARGAGDQGLMFGYACTDSERVAPGSYMPLAAQLSHLLARRLAEVRRAGSVSGLGPDGKTQVTLRFRDGQPYAVESILISTQHSAAKPLPTLRAELAEVVVRPLIVDALCPNGNFSALNLHLNPGGEFILGGPEADSGLSGRKIIVDTYGGSARHGGGSFSGKDPSKVDRSASYYARYAAKNLVAAGLADRLELQVSYAIGRARPTSLGVTTFGTGRLPDERITALLTDGGIFDFRPLAIIEQLGLLRLQGWCYQDVAAYGHFGRTDLDLPWEKLDRVDAIQQAAGQQ